jgi:hypothetical protein
VDLSVLPPPAASVEFLALLRRKVGLLREWQPGTRLWRFTAEQWAEPDLFN